MKAPSKDPARSNPELDYAPPWARENLARENMTRANMARENMAREQLRPPLGERTSAEEIAAGASHTARDEQPYDRPWHHRALEPELVPEPPGGGPQFLADNVADGHRLHDCGDRRRVSGTVIQSEARCS